MLRRKPASAGGSAMRRLVFVFMLVGVAALLLPSMAAAQASISGTVLDASGGVLPGATVEVASPALIEKVRTATSDNAGAFRITGLRPGTYSVTFTMHGFSVS